MFESNTVQEVFLSLYINTFYFPGYGQINMLKFKKNKNKSDLKFLEVIFFMNATETYQK